MIARRTFNIVGGILLTAGILAAGFVLGPVAVLGFFDMIGRAIR